MLLKTYDISCDGVGCIQWVGVGSDTPREARIVMRSAGWKRIDRQDLCPKCQARRIDPEAR